MKEKQDRDARDIPAAGNAGSRTLDFRQVLDHSADAFFIHDDKGRFVEVNATACRNLGYSRQELLSMTVTDVDPSFDREAQQRLWEQIRQEGTVTEEGVHRRKDGSTFPVELRLGVLPTGEGVLYVVSARDISNRKMFDKALRESEERYRLLADNQLVGAIIIDQGVITWASRRFLEITGYSAEEMLDHMSPVDLVHPEDREMASENLRKRLSGEVASINFRVRALRKDGDVRVMEIFGSPMNVGRTGVLQAAVIDVTEQAELEHALLGSEEIYRRLFVANPIPLMVVDTETFRFLEVNNAAVEHYGYSREEFLSMTAMDIRPAADVNGASRAIRDSEPGRRRHGLWRHLKKDGSEILVEVTSYDFNYHGRSASLALCLDVTGREEAHAALADSESRFRTVFQASPEAIALYRFDDGTYVDVSDGFTRLTGFSRQDVQGRTSLDVGFWAGEEERHKVLAALDEAEEAVGLEVNFRRKGGEIRRGELSFKKVLISGDKHLLVHIQDVTVLRRAEAALKESEERFRLAFQSSPDASVIMRLEDNMLVDVNDTFLGLLGYAHRKEVLGRTPLDLGLWADEAQREELYRLIEETGRCENFECGFNSTGGQVLIGLLSARIIYLGDRPHLLAMARDVTELRQAEAAALESEERFRLAYKTAPDAVIVVDMTDQVVVDVNEGFTETTGYTRQETVGKNSLELGVWADPADRDRLYRLLEKDGKIDNLELDFIFADGSRRTGLMSVRLLGHSGRSVMLIYVKDVSLLREAQEQVRASLFEKEILLKEIHHRVKNNLQVISGLLDLQAHHITDRHGRDVYKESQNRVITMALIHEELYQARDLARVDFGAYLENLAGNLFASYGVGQDKVRLVLDVEHSDMVVDTAIPCGLIVNELMSNALKHAFPGGREGMVQVRFKSTGDREYYLEVTDDGVGLPPGMDITRSHSLGMQLVTVITEQLGGDLTVERGGGTSFRITFSEYSEAGTVLY